MQRLASACVAVLLLAACSSSPEPIEPKADATAATRSAPPKPSASPPTMPAIAKRNDATGAANFVLYWVKVSNYAANSGDTARLREISHPDCEGCNRYIDLYEKTYANGGYFEGGERTLEDIKVKTTAGESYVYARVNAAAETYRFSSAEAEGESPPETTSVAFATSRTGSGWTMTQIGLQ